MRGKALHWSVPSTCVMCLVFRPTIIFRRFFLWVYNQNKCFLKMIEYINTLFSVYGCLKPDCDDFVYTCNAHAHN